MVINRLLSGMIFQIQTFTIPTAHDGVLWQAHIELLPFGDDAQQESHPSLDGIWPAQVCVGPRNHVQRRFLRQFRVKYEEFLLLEYDIIRVKQKLTIPQSSPFFIGGMGTIPSHGLWYCFTHIDLIHVNPGLVNH